MGEANFSRFPRGQPLTAAAGVTMRKMHPFPSAGWGHGAVLAEKSWWAGQIVEASQGCFVPPLTEASSKDL